MACAVAPSDGCSGSRELGRQRTEPKASHLGPPARGLGEELERLAPGQSVAETHHHVEAALLEEREGRQGVGRKVEVTRSGCEPRRVRFRRGIRGDGQDPGALEELHPGGFARREGLDAAGDEKSPKSFGHAARRGVAGAGKSRMMSLLCGLARLHHWCHAARPRIRAEK